jgi:hypothetical protein
MIPSPRLSGEERGVYDLLNLRKMRRYETLSSPFERGEGMLQSPLRSRRGE